MRIIITGATGLIGTKLSSQLAKRGDDVTVFTRSPDIPRKELNYKIKFEKWDYNKPKEWRDSLNGKDAVIHLAGANLNAKRWNDRYKKIVYDSRINSTRQLVNAIKDCEDKPKILITASAVGIYGDREDDLLTENSDFGNDFLSKLCTDWEKEAEKIEEYNVRRVSLRIGYILSRENGLLKKLFLPFKFFIGGPLGHGRQWFPWIHIEDLMSIFHYVLENEKLKGAINCASSEKVRMKDFADAFGNALNRPSLFPVPKFVLKIIAGEIANAVVSSQKISVDKLLASGFKFKYGNLYKALKNLLQKNIP